MFNYHTTVCSCRILRHHNIIGKKHKKQKKKDEQSGTAATRNGEKSVEHVGESTESQVPDTMVVPIGEHIPD